MMQDAISPRYQGTQFDPSMQLAYRPTICDMQTAEGSRTYTALERNGFRRTLLREQPNCTHEAKMTEGECVLYVTSYLNVAERIAWMRQCGLPTTLGRVLSVPEDGRVARVQAYNTSGGYTGNYAAW